MLRRTREWIGAKLVRLGMRIVGIDEEKFKPGGPTWGDLISGTYNSEDEDEREETDSTCLPVQLNETARAMVQDGMTSTSPVKRSLPTKENMLAGSAQSRFQQERARQQEALRPKRG